MATIEVPTTLATLATEKLALTVTQRDRLRSAFMADDKQILKRILVVMPYHRYTADQIVAAMHESADTEGITMVVTASALSTMARSLRVVKAWVTAQGETLVDDDTRESVLTELGKLVGYSPSALKAYEITDAQGKRSGYRAVTCSPTPGGKVTFPEFTFHPEFGTGEKAMGDIVAGYMAQRVEGTPETALNWLKDYRRTVEFANNERRRKGQGHDTLAADARVGEESIGATAETKEQRGARVPEPTEVAATPEVPVVDTRARGEKTLSEASTVDLIRALHMRFADYSVALTARDTKEFDDCYEAYEIRFESVPTGTAIPRGKAMEKQQDAEAFDARYAVQVAPAPTGTPEQLLRAIMAELAADPEALAKLVTA